MKPSPLKPPVPSLFFKGLNLYLFLALAVSSLWLLSCSKLAALPDPIEITGQTMGTTYTVKFPVGKDTAKTPDKESLRASIGALLEEVNRRMSTYDPDSELSRFNRYTNTDWFPVSDDLARVVEASLLYSRSSGGAFDITVGPLVNLWGFGPTKVERGVPDVKEIVDTIRRVGYTGVSVKYAPGALKKDDPDLYLDLSAIAKGFGVDMVSNYLQSQGIYDYMVEIGGEVRAGGKNHLGEPWRIGISTPGGGYDIQKVVNVSRAALATSGDYRNYYEVDGKRYSHTIDARTGRPVTHGLTSVTVITESCMEADAWATTLMVLGPDEGLNLALRHGLAAFFIVKDGADFVEQMTPGFKNYLN